MNETENNIQTVQKGYEYFGKGDIDGLLSLFAKDIKWTSPTIANAPHTGPHNGVGEVREFFNKLAEGEDFSRFEPLEFIAQDDKVVVLGELASTVRSTGRTYETDWVHVFHLRDGKVTEFAEYFDTAAADKAFQLAAAA